MVIFRYLKFNFVQGPNQNYIVTSPIRVLIMNEAGCVRRVVGGLQAALLKNPRVRLRVKALMRATCAANLLKYNEELQMSKETQKSSYLEPYATRNNSRCHKDGRGLGSLDYRNTLCKHYNVRTSPRISKYRRFHLSVDM